MPKASGPGPQLVTPFANRSNKLIRERVCQEIKPLVESVVKPFYPAKIRQQIFFPDRKLVQFDSGKLQTLCELLRERKAGGHKCLIFTQMSKMLDILEVFLNLHAHSYVRLDGSTGIDRRQKLMDRFNTDPKLFCFILSTRSGGLGINLTGADTVIFYDSDWNPAMDAQAQDRAHRIGQTKEVHIYRLVCSSTIEENILTKAKQKRHLDYLVMTEGNFNEDSLFTTDGLKGVLGAVSTPGESTPGVVVNSKIDMEAAMAAVEDDEDVSAMRGARAELLKDQEEFDENAPVVVGEDDEEDKGTSKGQSSSSSSSSSSSKAIVTIVPEVQTEEKDMEAEFASWQAKVGPDFRALESALKPVERFALRFRTDLEPYYSIFYINEQQRLLEMGVNEAQEKAEMWDVEEIEREKEEEEYRAFAEGDLLATSLTKREISHQKKWYQSERIIRNRARRRRLLTGAGWSLIIDPLTSVPFWYNDDTGEASYGRPKIIEERDAMESALERGYVAAPLGIMIAVFKFLCPYPDRMSASSVCSRWRDAASDSSFLLRVLSVETGTTEAVKSGSLILAANTFTSISNALLKALPGDTLSLGVGHHWEETLTPYAPVRVISETDDPSRCVVELTGQILITPAAKSMVHMFECIYIL